MQSVRIIEIPDCKMVSSGIGMFGEKHFDRFEQWFSSLPRGIFPKNFLFWDTDENGKAGFHWIYLYEEGMQIPAAFCVIDFKGGLYAVATDIDQQTNQTAMKKEVDEFLRENHLTYDPSRKELGNIITSPSAQKILGYEQMDYYFPVKAQK